MKEETTTIKDLKSSPENSTPTKEYVLDAAGKRLGRLASEIALLLQGKKEADYAPNKLLPIKVIVKNVDSLNVEEKTLQEKTYDSYSGYPGGRKVSTMKKVVEKKGMEEILRRAVNGMLPKNKLQKRRLQNLIIEK